MFGMYETAKNGLMRNYFGLGCLLPRIENFNTIADILQHRGDLCPRKVNVFIILCLILQHLFFLPVKSTVVFQNFQLLAKMNQLNVVRDLDLVRCLKLSSKYEELSGE